MSARADEILKCIDFEVLKLPSEMRSVHTPIMQEIVHKLIQLMKQVSQTFANLKPEILFMGSYFEGLKIVAPDEYDLNIVLKLPHLILDWEEVPVGFTRINVASTFLDDVPEVRAWVDDSGYLKAARARYWLQSVIQRALNTLPTDGDAYKLLGHRVARSSTGPAYTIKLSGGNTSGIIEVDLVPTFAFPLDSLTKHRKLNTNGQNINFKKNFFLAVPKGPKGCNPTLKEICWNIDCQPQELELLLDNHNLKPTIRLMKKFRERQGITLSSYCIKTLFFWEIFSNDETFWQINSISYLLKHMLGKFMICLQNGFIKNIWFPEQNMLGDIPKEKLKEWVIILHQLIHSINKVGARGRGLVRRFVDTIEIPSLTKKTRKGKKKETATKTLAERKTEKITAVAKLCSLKPGVMSPLADVVLNCIDSKMLMGLKEYDINLEGIHHKDKKEEIELLLDNYNMKPTIRLIMKFKESQGIEVSSHCIATLFLQEFNNINEQFWQNNSISHLLTHMLKKFYTSLRNNSIPNFVFPNQNMLPEISNETLLQWMNRIKAMLGAIHNTGRRARGLRRRLLSKQERKRFNKIVLKTLPTIHSLSITQP